MRRASKKDENHREIAQALASVCKVMDMSRVGGGFPDLLVCPYFGPFRSIPVLIEIKREKAKGVSAGKLQANQQEFKDGWPGPLFVVRNVNEAMECLGVVV